MSDHTENTLRAASKALSDVIGPALDPNDPLAAEQLRLVIEYLDFVRDRLDRLYERERFELKQALQTAKDIAATGGPERHQSQLQNIQDVGFRALDTVGLPPNKLREATAAVNAVIREIVREVSASGDSTLRDEVYLAVINSEADKVTFERAWYLPFGFDPEPQSVPSLAEVLVSERVASGN
jgi:hypothetical protein